MHSIDMSDILTVMGFRPGLRQIDVTFTNADIDTATVPETVSPVGGLLTFRTAAAVVEAVSSSASDTAAGVGAQVLQVHGLDSNYNEIQEDIPLNGTTPVLGALMFFRINAAHIHNAGSSGTNVGDITIRDAGAGVTRSFISTGQGVSEVGLFTVPAGHTLLATGWIVSARDSVGQKALVDVAFYTSTLGVRKIDWRMVVDGTAAANVGSPHIFFEKVDIEVVVTRVNTNDSYVSFHGHGILVGPGHGL